MEEKRRKNGKNMQLKEKIQTHQMTRAVPEANKGKGIIGSIGR